MARSIALLGAICSFFLVAVSSSKPVCSVGAPENCIADEDIDVGSFLQGSTKTKAKPLAKKKDEVEKKPEDVLILGEAKTQHDAGSEDQQKQLPVSWFKHASTEPKTVNEEGLQLPSPETNSEQLPATWFEKDWPKKKASAVQKGGKANATAAPPAAQKAKDQASLVMVAEVRENTTTSPAPPPPYLNSDNSGSTTEAPTLAPLPNMTQQDMDALSQSPERVQAALNCVVSDWSDWSDCAKSASSGQSAAQHSRTRTVFQPQQTNGTECPDLSEAESCTP